MPISQSPFTTVMSRVPCTKRIPQSYSKSPVDRSTTPSSTATVTATVATGPRPITTVPPCPILIIRIVGGQLIPTHGARVMQLKPRKQALIVVHVLARHLLHLRTLLELLLTNRALVQLRVQKLIVNGYGRELLDSVFRCRWRTVTVRVILGELLNQLLEACGAEEVIADVGGEAKPRLGRVVDHELNVGTVGAKALEVVLKEEEGVEHVRFGSGPGFERIGEEARVLEVDGGARSSGG